MIRKRRFPIVGDGGGVWSFIHIEDAADGDRRRGRARRAAAIYNVVDDEPAPVAEWLPALASALGAKPPRRVPRWLGRLLAGEAAAVMMTEVRGASNAKAKRELGWQPRYPSWRQGFAEGLGVSDGRARSCSRSCGRAAFAIAYRMLGSVERGRGRGAGGAAAPPPARSRAGERIESPRAYLVDRGHPAGDRRAALGAGAARDLRRRVAAGAARRPTTRTTRRARPRWPTRCRWPSSSCSRASRPSSAPSFLLREVFDYRYDRIAEIVGKSEDNARQLAARARRHVEERRPRFEASREQRERARRALLRGRPARATSAALEALLAHDVVLHGDGGGKVPALARALHGRARVARTLIAWVRKAASGSAASRCAAGRGQRAAGRVVLLDGESGDRRDGPRHRRRPDPGGQLDRQPRQARPPRAGRRPARRCWTAAAGVRERAVSRAIGSLAHEGDRVAALEDDVAGAELAADAGLGFRARFSIDSWVSKCSTMSRSPSLVFSSERSIASSMWPLAWDSGAPLPAVTTGFGPKRAVSGWILVASKASGRPYSPDLRGQHRNRDDAVRLQVDRVLEAARVDVDRHRDDALDRERGLSLVVGRIRIGVVGQIRRDGVRERERRWTSTRALDLELLVDRALLLVAERALDVRGRRRAHCRVRGRRGGPRDLRRPSAPTGRRW